MGKTLYFFRSLKDPDISGLTLLAEGDNLPLNHGTWDFVGVAIPLDIATPLMAEEITSAVKQDGYCLIRKATVDTVWPTASEAPVVNAKSIPAAHRWRMPGYAYFARSWRKLGG